MYVNVTDANLTKVAFKIVQVTRDSKISVKFGVMVDMVNINNIRVMIADSEVGFYKISNDSEELIF